MRSFGDGAPPPQRRGSEMESPGGDSKSLKFMMVSAESGKINMSCVPCRRRHDTCDRVSPTCTPCKQRGITCTYQQRKRWTRKGDQGQEHQPAKKRVNSGGKGHKGGAVGSQDPSFASFTLVQSELPQRTPATTAPVSTSTPPPIFSSFSEALGKSVNPSSSSSKRDGIQVRVVSQEEVGFSFLVLCCCSCYFSWFAHGDHPSTFLTFSFSFLLLAPSLFPLFPLFPLFSFSFFFSLSQPMTEIELDFYNRLGLLTLEANKQQGDPDEVTKAVRRSLCTHDYQSALVASGSSAMITSYIPVIKEEGVFKLQKPRLFIYLFIYLFLFYDFISPLHLY